MITIPGKLSYTTIESNLPDLTNDQLIQLSNSVSLAPTKLVGINLTDITKGTDKTFSIRLMKWVEPYRISGVDYSLFYTEVDHNFKVGDRCFIEGGFYDSDAFINSNIYNKGVDGYKVLYVDRTKIVLDIEFTGDLPTNEEEIDNFVKVYVANTQYEFDYYSQVISMRDDSGIIENKFQLGLNNFLYLNGTFSSNLTFTSFASDLSLSSMTSSLSNSWVIRGTTASNDYFVNITNDVLINNISPYLNLSSTQSNSGFFNLGKLRIMNSRFTSGGIDFMNERIYYFDNDQNKWRVDKSYLPTIITENHFKGGFFKGGSFNQGLYGIHEQRLNYQGSDIQWNLGTTLNVDWVDGTLDSQVYDPDSHFTIFDRDGLPQIRANAENNGGAGYNYVFNTEFSGGDVINGNIFNMSTIIGTNSTTQSTILNYYTGQPQNYSVEIKGGVYYNSDISFATMSNSTFISSYVLNSYINRCKSVNSEVESSVFLNSTWISDRIVKIQAYEESNIEWYDELNNPINYKMYKFYLTDTNWRRLREFQNFYIDGIGINIPSDELLRFFDDKFSLGHWSQTYDIVGSKPARKVLLQLSTKEENRNSPGQITTGVNDLQPNFDNPLPSIDLFISGGEDFDYGASSSYPRPFIGNTIDISKAYIIDSDFISGLFKDSRWISGNYFNYNDDYSFTSGSGYTASVTASTAQLTLNIGQNWRPDILGTTTDVSNIAFVNGLWYDSTLNGGNNLVKLPDVYKVDSLGGSPRQIVLQDIKTQSVYNSIGDFSNSQFLLTPNAKNQYNYVHPVKFETSQIYSGVFRRAYFENCLFDNFEFDITDKDLLDVENKRKLLVSDIILDGDGNIIRNGLFQYSHKIAGNDDWQNGIFHRGVWNTQTFTYSFGSTSSIIFSLPNSPFKDGIVRNTTWEFGQFDNGLFYNNRSNFAGTPLVFTQSRSVYYYEGYNTRWTWKSGQFNNGDFERSNFENGVLKDGNFYDSEWFIGEATGGNFGKSNIPFEKTRIWEGTFSNVNVINANFRSGDIFDSLNPFATASLIWNSGVFKSGVFGSVDDIIYSPTNSSNNRSIWINGQFDGGDFKDSAEWKNGEFNGGRFLSYYWYEPLNPRTPFELNTFTSASFSWQGGKFNGGQFGTGELSSNSTWFNGEFNGGLFQGRYWKDGIFTRGEFLGHGASYSTDIDNYNEFIRSFNTNYFGYWQDGFVSKVKDKFIKDEKLFTEVERVSTKKKKNPLINFKNMLWNSGTFSAFDGEMDNSLWLDGTFQEGYFANSVFNPYINLANSELLFETQFSISPLTGNILNLNGYTRFPIVTPQVSLPTLSTNESYTINYISGSYSFTGSTFSAWSSQTLSPGETYTLQIEIVENTNFNLYLQTFSNLISSTPGIITQTFVSTGRQFVLAFGVQSPGSDASISFRNVTLYPGTQSGFRTTDSCIWENGEAYSSDFYFSKWKQGVFDSFADSLQGNSFGLIWQNGITKYMNAYNVFWEGGIWKNGNWNGSPFTNVFLSGSQSEVYPGFAADLINNVASYAQISQGLYSSQSFSANSLHMNDSFRLEGTSLQLLSDINLINGFGNSLSSVTFSGATWSDDSLFGPDSVYTRFNDWLYATNSTSGINIIEEGENYSIEIKYRFAVFILGVLSEVIEQSIGDMTIQIGDYVENIQESFSVATQSVFSSGVSSQYTFNLSYSPSVLNEDFVRIRNNSIQNTVFFTTITPFLIIDSISIIKENIVYDELTNNELHSPIGWIPQIGSSIELPDFGTSSNQILYSAYGLKTRYGNGSFLSGIWENGVWNEGWRDDYTTIWATNLSQYLGGKNKAYKINEWTWRLGLDLINDTNGSSPGILWDGFTKYFNVGDKVSVGNIVTIDLNGDRRLIRDSLTITDIEYNLGSNSKIELEVIINFPIRSIEKDSEEHLIYITKNVWLNGVFLNGYFSNGVWNNGLFQGFPYITQMEDSHWIDGVFKGGHFKGLTNSYVDITGNSNNYHTAVIQNFEFYDSDSSGIPFITSPDDFKYNSWIDVNYYRDEGVNLNRINQVFKSTSLGFTSSFTENNHYGYPTKDVLSSVSELRNGYDLNSRKYRLGWKWKEYTNFLLDVGTFDDINDYNYNSANSPVPNQFGIDNFINDGWTFSYLPYIPFGLSINTIKSNIGNIDSEYLYISGGRVSPLVPPADSTENFNIDIFDNDKIEIDRLRYNFIEIEADNLFATSSNPYLNPLVFYNNYPASYSVATTFTLFNGRQVTIPINQIKEPSVVKQREYFFNKRKFDMLFFSSGTYSLRFKEIRFVETDMIPFLQLATDCIQQGIFTTWDTTPEVQNPAGLYVGPPGDPGRNYDDDGIGFPGVWGQALSEGETSTTSGLDGNLQVIEDLGPPTWDNFYLLFGGKGCQSNINDDIEVPYVAIAPDIETDIEFSYLSSVNIELSDTEIQVFNSDINQSNSGGIGILSNVSRSS